MDYLNLFKTWKNDGFFDEETRNELLVLDTERDKKEIEDRFYKSLEFGTGGLRGIMGAGTNRINKYTVGAASYGLGTYLIEKFGKEKCGTRGVTIGFDTRNNSHTLANVAASVLSRLGIRVFIMPSPRPTPMLSFAVRHLKSLAGIVITASHNPKEYNGYKVYDEQGCQVTLSQANAIASFINSIKDIRQLSFEGEQSLIETAELTDIFLSVVAAEARYFDKEAKRQLSIVYTPLHGSGAVPVTEILKKDGFSKVLCVEEQMCGDGNFPTVVSPNPEDKNALALGIALAKKNNADIVLATDPDCDRVGIAVKTDDGFLPLTGNQVGALLADFVIKNTDKLKTIKRPAIVKTVVTNELAAEIAREHGVSVFSTLTGFKFIGEKITQFEKAKAASNEEQNFTFLFGYEESYGYLCGTHARDKDAVVASMLICEMAASLKKENKTLLDRLNKLYEKYGYYYDELDSFAMSGKNGMEKMNSIMASLREGGSPFDNTVHITDYLTGVAAESGFGELPRSDVMKFTLSDGSWIAIRPSGTEPKIKFYYSIKAKSRTQAEKKLVKIKEAVEKIITIGGK